jgi:AbiV family abortive infection protein
LLRSSLELAVVNRKRYTPSAPNERKDMTDITTLSRIIGKQYRGRLSLARILDGMNAAGRNARRLLADAAMLHTAGRYPSAVALSVLCIEEAGKQHVLQRLTVAIRDEEIEECWREYRSHKSKNTMWIITNLVQSGAKTVEQLGRLFDPASGHQLALDRIKQMSFYTDCVAGGEWIEPSVIADETLSAQVLGIAQGLVPTKDDSLEALELWVKHIVPVNQADVDERRRVDLMKAAVHAWHVEALERGYITAPIDLTEQFVLGIPPSRPLKQRAGADGA